VVADAIVPWLLANGQVMADKGEWLDVVCPWHEQHSDDRVEAGYKPLGRGDQPDTRGFRCHHSHAGGTREYLEWVKANGGPDAAPMDTAAGWRAMLPGAMAKLAPFLPTPDEELEAEKQFTRAGRRQKQREDAMAVGEGFDVAVVADVLTPDEMRERFVLIENGSYVFDRVRPRHTLRLADARNVYAESVTFAPKPEGKGRPPKPTPNLELWLRQPGRLTAHAVTFDPAQPAFGHDPSERIAVNTWSGFRRPTVEPADPAIVVAHIRWLFNDRADEFLDWLAHIEQRPGELPHTAWLHVSSEHGTGRNLTASLLGRVWAGYAALCVDLPRLLDSGFNGRLESKLIAVVDEIREGGPERWRHADRLRQLVNEEQRTINRKYGLESTERNVCRWLVFSNSRAALPLDSEDRRFEVVVNDEPPRDEDYYTRLAAAVQDPAIVLGFAQFLEARELEHFNPGRHAKKTPARAQVIHASRPAADDGLIDYLEANADREVFLVRELQAATGLSAVSGETAVRFAATAGRCGLVKLARLRIGGKITVVYCRQEVYGNWRGRISEIAGLKFPEQAPGPF
jgi:hypothetical protein